MYIAIEKLEVYNLARELSREGWTIYKTLSFSDIKLMGDQFIRSIDSIGANIIEGYGRYHYLDKKKYQSGCEYQDHDRWYGFYLDRGSHLKTQCINTFEQKLQIKLNNFISTTYKSKNNQ